MSLILVNLCWWQGPRYLWTNIAVVPLSWCIWHLKQWAFIKGIITTKIRRHFMRLFYRPVFWLWNVTYESYSIKAFKINLQMKLSFFLRITKNRFQIWVLYKTMKNRNQQGAVSIRKTVLPGMAIAMLKIRRPNGRLIFNMEIAIRR